MTVFTLHAFTTNIVHCINLKCGKITPSLNILIFLMLQYILVKVTVKLRDQVCSENGLYARRFQ